MRVLVACEMSGRVRDAFIARGHEAVSCDLLPTEQPGPHVQGDVTPLLKQDWDLLIAFPPCQYLTYAGMAHWNKPGRAENRQAALDFFLMFYYSVIPKICVENPMGYPVQMLGPPTQIINPFAFGHPVRKRTCLWLRNLPKLKATNLVGLPPTVRGGARNKTRNWCERQPPGPERSANRSRTFQGVADAMAAQWGGALQ